MHDRAQIVREGLRAVLQTTKDILADLIAFPTVSADSNLDMIAYLASRLEDCGADVHLFTDPSGKKANLFATLGPQKDGGIVLSGHSDVVPVTDQNWTSDPFKMVGQKEFTRSMASAALNIGQPHNSEQP